MADYSCYDRIHVLLEEKVLRITFNRPEKRNIIDDFVSRQLSDVITEASMDSDVAVVVLTGEGSVFCGGGDFAQMKRKIEDPNLYFRGIQNSKRLVYSVLDCPKPIICSLNGDAIGLGATLALLCDIVIAREDAKILDPHTRVGLVCGDGGSLLWPALIGYARAKRYLLAGEPIEASEAAYIGLITFAVPEEDRKELTEKWVSKLANGAAHSIQGTKITINLPLRAAAQAAMDVGMAYEGLSNISRDHAEAVMAFQEKRKPVFTGE